MKIIKEMAMSKPNIFEFATGELSQDAFICWSLAWGKQRENTQMRKFGLTLLNTMLETHQYNVQNLERITIIDVKNQVNAIDVLVTFKIDEQEFELIIEDKTNTTMHSSQIERYFDQRIKQSPEKIILGLYYKTGFIFDDEETKLENLRKKNYPVKSFDKEKILRCMSHYLKITDSDIFHDYYNYIKKKYGSEREILQNIHSPHIRDLEKSLNTQAGQVEVLKYIFGKVRISRGRSYGRPWVNYSFKKGSYKDPEVPLPDALFYRIDKKKQGFYISLRQYRDLKKKSFQHGETKNLQQLKLEKLERLHKLTNIFDDIIADIKRDFPEKYIEPGKKTKDRRGYNESEIGVFYFTEVNTTARFKAFFDIFHERFCHRLVERFRSSI